MADLQHLIRSMVCPDPAYRITAMEAYHHPALALPAPSVIVTPHFVRAAAAYEDDLPPVPAPQEHEPRPAVPTARLVTAMPTDTAGNVHADGAAPAAEKKKQHHQQQRKKKQDANQASRTTTAGPKLRHARSATPTALGESIKQHTAVANEKVPSKNAERGVAKDEAPVVKLVIRQTRLDDDENVRPAEETTREFSVEEL